MDVLQLCRWWLRCLGKFAHTVSTRPLSGRWCRGVLSQHASSSMWASPLRHLLPARAHAYLPSWAIIAQRLTLFGIPEQSWGKSRAIYIVSCYSCLHSMQVPPFESQDNQSPVHCLPWKLWKILFDVAKKDTATSPFIKCALLLCYLPHNVANFAHPS